MKHAVCNVGEYRELVLTLIQGRLGGYKTPEYLKSCITQNDLKKKHFFIKLILITSIVFGLYLLKVSIK